ncbi:MAG: hypothetical protein ORN54_09080 [Cyclobacteriaceae bacterium]|nr:hypothetical protein [Cyclobacteriaceae bacterium]
MTPLKFVACLFVLGAISFSCRQTNLKYDKPYFDFDSLVNIQISYLANRKDSVHKTASIDGKKGLSSFLADSVQLAHEWDVFRQLDVINKPTYKGHYIVTEEKDSKSNLTIRRYTCDIKSSVPVVLFYFQNDLLNLRRIESQYIEQNALYFTTRQLTLSLDGAKGQIYVYDYAIKGVQKMILSDSVQFSIHAYISKNRRWPNAHF